MARKQMQIPGTERREIPEIAEAGEKWRELRKEKRRVAEREKEAKWALVALMQSHKIEAYKVIDEETKEVVLLTVDLEPKLRAKKTGEAEDEVATAIETITPADGSVHPGLIAQAERANLANGVHVNSDGDVVPPDVAAPKQKRKRKAKADEQDETPLTADTPVDADVE